MELLNKLRNIVKKEDDKLNFNKLVEEWLETKKISIKESTYCNYVYSINKYIMPTFENITIEELQNYNFNDFVMELMEKLATKTVRDILCILKAILYYANEEHNYNIKVSKITSPKLVQGNVTILSNKEKGRLENYCIRENTLKSIGIVICLNTGIRIGELCALQWKNIDLDKKILYVKNTLQRIYDNEQKQTKIIIDVPKTAKSIRQIPISNKLYEILKTIEKKYKDNNFFLTGNSEKFVEPRNYQKYFKTILRKCRIKSYKFHTLRHTFASNCIEVGMDVKSLSEMLGHSSVEITLNKYVHSNYKMQKKYLEKL
jgi:integrase